MKKLIQSLLITAFVTTLLCGASCKVENVTYKTTDAVGNAVDKAMQGLAQYEVAKAQNALGAFATQSQLSEWVSADKTWQQASQKHAQYLQAYNAWCAANAAIVAAGTNASAVGTSEFQTRAISAATDLTSFVAQFVTSTAIVR